jgi:hypothetical protein
MRRASIAILATIGASLSAMTPVIAAAPRSDVLRQQTDEVQRAIAEASRQATQPLRDAARRTVTPSDVPAQNPDDGLRR